MTSKKCWSSAAAQPVDVIARRARHAALHDDAVRRRRAGRGTASRRCRIARGRARAVPASAAASVATLSVARDRRAPPCRRPAPAARCRCGTAAPAAYSLIFRLRRPCFGRSRAARKRSSSNEHEPAPHAATDLDRARRRAASGSAACPVCVEARVLRLDAEEEAVLARRDESARRRTPDGAAAAGRLSASMPIASEQRREQHGQLEGDHREGRTAR